MIIVAMRKCILSKALQCNCISLHRVDIFNFFFLLFPFDLISKYYYAFGCNSIHVTDGVHLQSLPKGDSSQDHRSSLEDCRYFQNLQTTMNRVWSQQTLFPAVEWNKKITKH